MRVRAVASHEVHGRVWDQRGGSISSVMRKGWDTPHVDGCRWNVPSLSFIALAAGDHDVGVMSSVTAGDYANHGGWTGQHCAYDECGCVQLSWRRCGGRGRRCGSILTSCCDAAWVESPFMLLL